MSLPVIPADHDPSLPSPPFVTVAGIQNFRDLGGHPISSSSNHSVKAGIIYRCAEPSKVTEDGIETMKGLGITHIYDLRSEPEIKRSEDAGRGGVVEWEGCQPLFHLKTKLTLRFRLQRVFVPVFKDTDYSPESLAVRLKDYASKDAEGFSRAYTDILNNAPPSYRTILLHLINEPEKPLIFHCTAGKDRTGVLGALILSLCGVEDEIVAQEYNLTEVGLSKEWKAAVIEHLMDNPALKGNPEGCQNLISAKFVNMMLTLKVIREKFGGVENYMIERCGLTKEQVEQLKRNLIVEKAAENKMSL